MADLDGGAWVVGDLSRLEARRRVAASSESRIDQPMIRRLKTSWTAARKRKPWPVWMYLRSHTQSRFGSARAKSRSTRSGAESRLGSRTVVRTPPRRPSAPRMPSWRINRATRFLPTRIPSPSFNSEWIRGAP